MSQKRPVGIIADTTTDISLAQARELDMILAPVTYIIDGEPTVITMDIDRAWLVDHMAQAKKFSSSGVNINDYYNAYLQLLECAESLIVVTPAPELSMTYSCAVKAAELVEGARIQVFDSRGTYTGQAAIALQAARRALAGESFEQVASFVEQAIPSTKSFVISPNLAYAQAIRRLTEARDEAGREMNLAVLRIAEGKAMPILGAADYDDGIEKLVAQAVAAIGRTPIYATLADVRRPEERERLGQKLSAALDIRDLAVLPEGALGMLAGGVGSVAFGFCAAIP